MNKISFLRTVAVLLCLALVGACAGPSGKRVDERFNATEKKLGDFAGQNSPVQVSVDPYIGTPRPVPLDMEKTRPPFLKKRIVLIEGSMTMSLLAQRLSQVLKVPVTMAPIPKKSSSGADSSASGGSSKASGDQAQTSNSGVSNSATMTVNFRGTVENLLDTIAGRFSIQWEYDEETGGILFFKVKTRIFTLLANPGKTNNKSTITNKSDSGSLSGESGSAGGDTSSLGEQVSKFNSEVDVWAQTITSIGQMLSEHGGVAPNESAGTVTVTDTPIVLDRVEKYLREVNRKLSRQTAITVTVFSVAQKEGSNVGMSLDLALKNFGFNIVTDGGSPITAAAGASSFTGVVQPNSLRGQKGHEYWNGFQDVAAGSMAVASALNQWGKTTVVTRQNLLTLHQQTMPVQVVRNVSYLKGSTSTMAANTGTSTSLTPGSVTTGFSLMVTPNILNNNSLILQYSLSLSTLDDIKEIISGDSRIQLPEVSSRSFSQRVALKSGSTLIIGGFESDTEGGNKGYGLLSFGRSSDKNRQIIVICIDVDNVEGAGNDLDII